MSDINKGDTVYYTNEIFKVVDILDTIWVNIKNPILGSRVIKRSELETEKEFFTRRLEEIEGREKEPVWPLPENTNHFFYGDQGEIHDHLGEFEQVNCNQALSEKRCKQLYQKSLLMQDMYLWVDTFCPEWEPDWSDCKEDKFGITVFSGKASYMISKSYISTVFGISAPSEELAKKMLKEFKERIEEWY